MSKLSTKQRQQAVVVETLFPGDRISAAPLPAGSDIASIRSGRGNIDRIPWMLKCNRDYWQNELASYREDAYDLTKAEDRKTFSNVIKKSYGNRELSRELAAYREFTLQHEVLASVFAFGAFQNVALGDDELPLIITPRARQYFNIRYFGNDGQARRDQWQDDRSAELITMRRLTTDKIAYPMFDIQTGKINVVTDINAQLRFDMDMKLDVMAQDNLDAGKTTSGLRALLQLHPKVIAANVPDTNYLDLTGTNHYTLTISKIKTILAHIASWGVDGVTPDGGFTIQSIVISPQNMRDQWDYVDLVSGFSGGDEVEPSTTVPRPVREDIFNTGIMNRAWGYSWNTIPNARLDKGRLYVFSNQPVGWYFNKPALDQVITWEGPDDIEKNEGHVVYNKVLNFAMPDLWLHRYVIVDF